MKHIIILSDGMADEPIEALGGKTPMQAAYTPFFDELCAKGRCGTLDTSCPGFEPGSEVAHLSLLGYDIPSVFEGRGTLEAAAMGVDIEPGEIAMRCNLICIEDGKIKNHSAGHISDGEAAQIIDFLNAKLGDERVRFFSGVSYRHLLKVRGGDKRIAFVAPHDVPGVATAKVMPKALVPEAQETVELLTRLISLSQQLLPAHPVNLKRIEQGKDPANSIWPWSAGNKPAMTSLAEKYGVKQGAVITAVDLIRGIGIYCGLRVINVEGATGLYNTNYAGKAQAAIKALQDGCDFVFLHIEAPDEAGHDGNFLLKTKVLEDIDKLVCKPVIDYAQSSDEPVAIAILPDHPTPCRTRTHSRNPVPVLIYNPLLPPDAVKEFNELSVLDGALGAMAGDQFISKFLKDEA